MSGVLGKAQRNHGTLLIICFSLVLVAAVAWVAAPLTERFFEPPVKRRTGQLPPSRRERMRRLHLWLVRHRVGVRTGLQLSGVLLFLAGVIVGIFALIATHTMPNDRRYRRCSIRRSGC